MIKLVRAELAKLRDPRTLWFGVVSGYALTACFAVLLAVALATDTLPWHWAFAVLLGVKLCTNTLALIGLKLDRFALELGGINVAADAFVMTGVIWATGDIGSPLVAIYPIEVCVLALLTNLTCTVLIGAAMLVLYVAMALLAANGVIPAFSTPLAWSGRSTTYIIMACAFAAFVIAAPTLYSAGLLRRLRRRERALEAHAAALVDAGKQKAQFMANITHELRTPLQGVMGLSDLVATGIYGETTERQRLAMADIKASAKRLHALIDDLLLVAMQDAGRLELKLSTVDIGDVVAKTCASAHWLLAGKQLRIDCDVPANLQSIRTDRMKVSQILLNLLSNAIKFTPDGGAVSVRARVDGEGVVVEVEDTGVGIAADALDRVFDEFFQVDGSAVREYGGVGLGLALVKRMVALLGGSVAVKSELGRGTTFAVRLPASAPADVTRIESARRAS